MKRIMLAVSMALALGAGAFADHPAGLGVGLVAVSDYGSAGMGSQLGLSLKLRGIPIFWGAHLSFNANYLGLGVTGDRYFNDEGLIREKSFKLDWFLGLGGYANLAMSSSPSASLGARLPIGLSWHPTREFEVWLDIAPSLGIGLSPLSFPNWGVPAEIGVRAWLK